MASLFSFWEEAIFFMVYKYFIYDCIYQACGKAGNDSETLEYDLQTNLSHHACFAGILNQIKRHKYADVNYKVYLFQKSIQGKGYNLLTKQETRKVLRCLKKTVPFNYNFSKSSYTLSQNSQKQVPFTVLNINLKGIPAQHVWLTTMLRCFFEFPYNVAAKETCRLQSDIKVLDGVDLSKQSWINLYFSVVSQLGSNAGHGLVSGNVQPVNRSYSQWENELKNLKKFYSVCNSISERGCRFSSKVDKVTINNAKEMKQEFPNRALKYVAAYKEKLSWKK